MTEASTLDNPDLSIEPGKAVALDRATIMVVAVMGLAAFMAVLDGTIVTVAIDSFATTFDTPISTVVWISVSYLLAAGLALPTAGWAVERYGGRRVFLTGLSLFVLGSALASLAWSAESLIGFRVVQGFGGGLLEPTALTLAAGAAGKQRVGKVMGILSLIVNVAPVLGPLTGGLFTTGGNWRWIFLINLPIGVIVAAGAFVTLPKDTGSAGSSRADLRGLLLLSPGFASILFAIDRLGASGATWTWVLPGLVGIVLFGSYVRHALRIDNPIVDVRLLRFRSYATSVGVMAFVGFIMYSQLIALPLYLHRVHGYSGVGQGLLTTALGAGLLVSMSLGSRRSDVTGPRPLVVTGAVVTAIGLATFAVFEDSMSVGALAAVFVIVGLGFGLVAAPTFSSVYRTVPGEAVAQATTTMFIVVQLSASFGVTMIGFLLSDADSRRFGTVFAILAVAAAVIAVIGRRLPGRPGAVRVDVSRDRQLRNEID